MEIEDRMDRLERMMLLSVKEMLTVKDLSAITGFKESYIRKLVEDCKLPYYKPLGKMILFDKSEIMSFLHSNRVPSVQEIITHNTYERNI